MNIAPTRRGFLGAAGFAGLGALGVTPSTAAIEPTPFGVKLGVATYTFRKFDRARTIEFLRIVGAPWVSVKDVHMSQTDTPDQLRTAHREFEAAGLILTSGGNVSMTNDPDIESLRKRFEYARNAGFPMLVCAPTHDNIKAVEALVKEYNIRVAIHNHGPEDKHFPTPQSVLDVVRKLDGRCGLCLDVGHSVRTGADVVKSIADAGDRLFDVHVKDLRDFSSRDSQCDVGDGSMPFPAIFKQLKKMNYQGCVNLEYEIHENDPMPGVQRSFSYMRGVLAGLAAA